VLEHFDHKGSIIFIFSNTTVLLLGLGSVRSIYNLKRY